eukprot:6179982-Pleurochrysis_carterae.AAC.8
MQNGFRRHTKFVSGVAVLVGCIGTCVLLAWSLVGVQPVRAHHHPDSVRPPRRRGRQERPPRRHRAAEAQNRRNVAETVTKLSGYVLLHCGLS